MKCTQFVGYCFVSIFIDIFLSGFWQILSLCCEIILSVSHQPLPIHFFPVLSGELSLHFLEFQVLPPSNLLQRYITLLSPSVQIFRTLFPPPFYFLLIRQCASLLVVQHFYSRFEFPFYFLESSGKELFVVVLFLSTCVDYIIVLFYFLNFYLFFGTFSITIYLPYIFFHPSHLPFPPTITTLLSMSMSPFSFLHNPSTHLPEPSAFVTAWMDLETLC